MFKKAKAEPHALVLLDIRYFRRLNFVFFLFRIRLVQKILCFSSRIWRTNCLILADIRFAGDLLDTCPGSCL